MLYEYKVKITGPGDNSVFSLGSIQVPLLELKLCQNYPNPFNPKTTIKFALPRESLVNLNIYDVRGRLVRSLISAKQMEATFHESVWDGKDLGGNAVSSGVYFYRLTADTKVLTKKMVLLK
jgi:hypothetical protein